MLTTAKVYPGMQSKFNNIFKQAGKVGGVQCTGSESTFWSTYVIYMHNSIAKYVTKVIGFIFGMISCKIYL